MPLEIILDLGALILCLVAIAFVVIYLPVKITTEQACLEAGWKDSKVTWNLQRYCFREENEYEITKPLKEVKK